MGSSPHLTWRGSHPGPTDPATLPCGPNQNSHQPRNPMRANKITSHSHLCDPLTGTESITTAYKTPVEHQPPRDRATDRGPTPRDRATDRATNLGTVLLIGGQTSGPCDLKAWSPRRPHGASESLIEQARRCAINDARAPCGARPACTCMPSTRAPPAPSGSEHLPATSKGPHLAGCGPLRSGELIQFVVDRDQGVMVSPVVRIPPAALTTVT
jgi:hypothetical protein